MHEVQHGGNSFGDTGSVLLKSNLDFGPVSLFSASLAGKPQRRPEEENE
jgi:hypothetical protein